MVYFLGVIVSLIVEAIKRWVGTSTPWTYVCLVLVSLIGGWVYVMFQNSSYWETIVQIVTTAAAFHTLLLKRLLPSTEQ